MSLVWISNTEEALVNGHPREAKKVSVTGLAAYGNVKIPSLYGSWEKRHFVKVAVSRAFCLQECPLAELPLYGHLAFWGVGRVSGSTNSFISSSRVSLFQGLVTCRNFTLTGPLPPPLTMTTPLVHMKPRWLHLAVSTTWKNRRLWTVKTCPWCRSQCCLASRDLHYYITLQQ